MLSLNKRNTRTYLGGIFFTYGMFFLLLLLLLLFFFGGGGLESKMSVIN